MPSHTSLYNSLRTFITTVFSLMPAELSGISKNLAITTLKKTQAISHRNFLQRCLRFKIIPTGFVSKFHPSISQLQHRTTRQLAQIEEKCAFHRMRCVLEAHERHIYLLSKQISSTETSLRHLLINNRAAYLIIRVIIHTLNQQLYSSLTTTKKDKFNRLRPNSPTHLPTLPSKTITQVVCIPENLPLSNDERSILSKGLNFIPLRPYADRYTLQQDANRFIRRARLQFHFHKHNDKTSEPTPNDELASLSTFEKRNTQWTPPPGESKALDLYANHTLHEIQQFKPKRLTHSNLSTGEWRALASLRHRQDIVIKPADKGGAVVVWNRELYIQEGNLHLTDPVFYSTRTDDPTISNNSVVKNQLNSFIQVGALPKKATHLRVFDSNLGKPCMYLLPKIHKPNNPGRPIVSACSCPTVHISEFLDGIFQPLVNKLPSYIKDTNHALSIFDSTRLLPGPPYHLFLLDVCSLYTSIPHSDGLNALQFFLDRRVCPSVSTSTLVRLAELVLTLNSFEFNGEYFDQISGVAMGTKMGPSYACLFMGYLEHLVWQSYGGKFPEVYGRYIDDGVGITQMSLDELNQFIHFFSNFNPAIKFTSHISTISVNFLDITVNVNFPILTTTVHYKPTDSHSYLLYGSSHPPSCKNAIPYSQLLRLRRLCSDDSDFSDKALELLDFFRARDYPEPILREALRKVSSTTRTEAFSTKPHPTPNRTKLILTFHPNNLAASKIFLRHYNILCSDHDTHQVFNEKPLVVYRRDKNLKDILVRSRLPVHTNTPSGTTRCSRPRCKTCRFVVQTPSVTFPKGTFNIRETFTCESRNIIYALICKRCNMAYVGETGRRLADRFREHLMDIKNEAAKPVSLHFNSPDHRGENDISVTALKSCSSDQVTRQAMENRFIYSWGVLSPAGMNIQHTFL